MRSAAPVVLALACLASSPVHAAKRSKPAAAASKARAPKRAVRPLTDEARGEIAASLVKKSLQEWTKKGTKVSIRPALVPFNGDVRNPITGRGPVEVFVTQTSGPAKGVFGRLTARLNPFAKQKYLVAVDELGRGAILERLSLAPHRRFARYVAEHLPIASFVLDFYKSKRAAEGLWTAVGGAGALAVSPMLSGALFTRLAMVAHEGVRSQNELRNKALDETVAWAQQSKKQDGAWPTLMETYRAYKGKVADQQDSARPLALGDFAEALSIRQL